MNETPEIQEGAQAATTEMIREVCQQNQAEPGAIWDALEAKGVETTPGMIYQVFNAPAQPANGDQVPSAPPEPGLVAEDLAILNVLATKAGGVEQLIRIMNTLQVPHSASNT